MRQDDPRYRLNSGGPAPQAKEPGLLAKLFAVAGGVVLLVVGVMFSLVIVVAAAIIAAGVLGYLWWKTRDLRRQMRENPPGGHVIEGEATRRED